MFVDPSGLQASSGGSDLCFDFDKFANQVEQNRSGTAVDLAALVSAEAVGTMPKTPGELRGLAQEPGSGLTFGHGLIHSRARMGNRQKAGPQRLRQSSCPKVRPDPSCSMTPAVPL